MFFYFSFRANSLSRVFFKRSLLLNKVLSCYTAVYSNIRMHNFHLVIVRSTQQHSCSSEQQISAHPYHTNNLFSYDQMHKFKNYGKEFVKIAYLILYKYMHYISLLTNILSAIEMCQVPVEIQSHVCLCIWY